MVQQMTELKPCPFCGGDNISLEETCVIHGDYSAICQGSKLYACGVEMTGSSLSGLIAAWNTRTPPQVKPLVWQRNGNHWAGGHGYVVRKFGSEHTLTVRNQFDRNFPTVEAAKEAAQADYTLRIMEALV